MSCPACGTAPGPEATCPGCGRLLPPEAMSAFTVLGLPERFGLELAALEDRYHRRARTLHPDRHQRRPPEEQVLATLHTEALNRAHETLLDPLERTRHLLELRGVPLPAGLLPVAFAGRYFALQDAPEQLPAFHAELLAAEAEAAAEVVRLGAATDATGTGLEAIAAALARHGYLAAMRRDLAAREVLP